VVDPVRDHLAGDAVDPLLDHEIDLPPPEVGQDATKTLRSLDVAAT
jgi:hypothetical protein